MSDTMSSDGVARGTLESTELFDLLSNHRARGVLRTLRDRLDGVTPPDLATVLASEEHGVPLHDVTADQRTRILTSLRHHHLPKLESASLVTTDDGGRVRLTDPLAMSAAPAENALALRADPDVIDRTFAALASEKRRSILAALRDESEMEVGALVTHLTDDLDGLTETDATVSLHHRHLPKLDEAGVVDYDRATGNVTYEGIPVGDDEWLEGVLGGGQQGSEPDRGEDAESERDGGDGDVWTIRGREDVVARGQALFDRADEELFLMVSTDGLLEPTCIEKLHDALDRGVDVYLGSQTSEVRDLVREEAPGVTIWEPQLNWLNLPPTRETLGRLVMADREAVMLGTLGEELDDGNDSERALTGEGAGNPLVILMRETLGARLDHLDGQSADVRSQIPL